MFHVIFPSNISTPYNGTHSTHDVHHEHPIFHYALLFMFTAVAIGTTTQYFLSRKFPSLPYTVVLLVEGVILALIHESSDGGLGMLSTSINMWQKIDPHLLLFAFLPVLLFGDAMSLNYHQFTKCFWQCFLLACPGVLLGTFLTAAVARYVLPYDWSW